HFLVAYALE
ncbi:hypothetical protein D020_2192B, partial [Vibrio parahaemolyticus SBR10290]